MATDGPPQPSYLTLTELVVSHALFGGLGYLVAGWIGFWCGLAAVTVWYGRFIWLAAYYPAQGRAEGGQPGSSSGPPTV
jgi:hypothetical protein